uniref:aminotransferase class I/II-fold pyridoxal phosphate-dependent enzyme n=1 Tax=Ndongobacter massiliensis TaxID=1871025 RepID=UPI000930DB73|nr:aminotransferase class V-fold PLP-dependent enzyme [Ndongobacter massiliensis]
MEEKKQAYVLPEHRPVEPWHDDLQFELELDALRSLSTSGLTYMHMPGHKRNTAKFGSMLGIGLDVTESKGMDNLHDPKGPFLRNQERLAAEFGAQKSYYMVNGSTGGILAAFRAGTKREDTVIVARNAHKSTYHALEICDLNPVFLSPEIDEDFGLYGSVDPEKIRALLEVHPETRLVAVTSPTYEGVFSDIRSIAQIVHEHGALLLVDEAHGAHTHYCRRLGADAVACGADFVIESLHKTLPSLTSTALLHISSRVDVHRMDHVMAVFETTSPSHLLLASIDECEAYLRAHGVEEHDRLFALLDAFSARMKELRILRVLCMGNDRAENHLNIFEKDPTKIVVSTRQSTISGADLMNRLRAEYKVEMEMAYGDYAMAISTIGDTEKNLVDFANALLAVDQSLCRAEEERETLFVAIPERAVRVADALENEREYIAADASLGRIAGEYAWAYPPGIPLVTPGEIINESALARFRQLEAQGIVVKTDTGRMPEEILVLKE